MSLERELQIQAKSQVNERFRPHIDALVSKLPPSDKAYKVHHVLKKLVKELDGMAIAMANEVANG